MPLGQGWGMIHPTETWHQGRTSGNERQISGLGGMNLCEWAGPWICEDWLSPAQEVLPKRILTPHDNPKCNTMIIVPVFQFTHSFTY